MDPKTNETQSFEIPPVPQLSAIPPSGSVPLPNLPAPPPAAKDGERDPVKDAQYAASLIQMTNMKYELEQARKPKRQIISTKKIIYIGISIAITILSLIVTPLMLKGKGGDTKKDTTQQIIDSSNYVKDIEK